MSTKLRFLFRKLKFAEWREIAICWRHRPDCTLCTQRRCARNCALVKVVRNLYENFNVDCIASAKTFERLIGKPPPKPPDAEDAKDDEEQGVQRPNPNFRKKFEFGQGLRGGFVKRFQYSIPPS